MKFLAGLNLLIIVLVTFLVAFMWRDFAAITTADLIILGVLNVLAVLANGFAFVFWMATSVFSKNQW